MAIPLPITPPPQKYRPIAELGRGGMAEVFLAVAQGQAGFNKLAVLKKIRAELAIDPDFTAMLLDEARLAARLSHPNIVQTYEVGVEEDRYFIAMEFLDGQPLSRVRHRAMPDGLPLAMHLRILADALAGLHHAHELCDFDGTPLNVVHRDATPQNLFVTYEGFVKVVDFGIAKVFGATAETNHGMLKGKVAYMPPEQARGEPVDRRADIFSVGVMLWEAVTNKRFWKGVEPSLLRRLTGGDLPDVRAAKADLPEDLVRIVSRAVAVLPADRYQTAAEMQADLEQYLDSLGERVGPREIGKQVALAFADERAKMKALIESHLRDIRWTGTYPAVVAALPRLDATSTSLPAVGAITGGEARAASERSPEAASSRSDSASRSGSVSALREVSPTSVRRLPDPAPLPVPSLREPSPSPTSSRRSGPREPEPPGPGPREPSPIPQPALDLRVPSAITAPSITAASAALPPNLRETSPSLLTIRYSRRVHAMFAAVGGAVALAFFVAVRLLAPGDPLATREATAQPAPPAPSAEAPEAAKAEPSTAWIRVMVDPAEAKIFLDDVLVGTGSFEGRVPKDGALRKVGAVAPGYVPRTEFAMVNADVVISLSLVKEAHEEGAAVRSPVRAAPPLPVPGASRTRHPIDADNPYGK